MMMTSCDHRRNYRAYNESHDLFELETGSRRRDVLGGRQVRVRVATASHELRQNVNGRDVEKRPRAEQHRYTGRVHVTQRLLAFLSTAKI